MGVIETLKRTVGPMAYLSSATIEMKRTKAKVNPIARKKVSMD